MNQHVVEPQPLVLRAEDGVELRGFERGPEGPAQAAVILVHGMGEHGQTAAWLRLAEVLAAAGCRVVACDLRGHGRSGGGRMFVRAWRDFTADLNTVREHLHRVSAAAPLFLVGLSMGGLIVADSVLQAPEGLRGVVLCSPPLGKNGASPVMLTLLRLLERVAPALRLDPGLDRSQISRDEAALRAYLADPLVTSVVTPRLANGLLDAAERIRAEVTAWRLPVLVMHGAADNLADPQGSVDFHARVAGPDKTLRLLPAARHNLFIEPESGQVFADIAAWIMHRARSALTSPSAGARTGR